MKRIMSSLACLLCLWAFGVAAQDCLIKGIIGPTLRLKIYLLPDHYLYKYINVYEQDGERWFCSQAEAKQAGFVYVPNTPPENSEFTKTAASSTSPPPR